jgi:hypothetical protein
MHLVYDAAFAGKQPKQQPRGDLPSTPVLNVPLSIIDRLMVSRIVPLQAKLDAIESCLSELKGIVEAGQSELEMRLLDALHDLKAQAGLNF